MEKINIMLSNQQVMETVAKISEKIKQEKDFSLAKFIEQTLPAPVDIQKKKQSDMKKFEFERQMELLRRQREGEQLELGTTDPLSTQGCLLRLKKRMEFFDSAILPGLETDERRLLERIQERTREQMKKNYSFSLEGVTNLLVEAAAGSAPSRSGSALLPRKSKLFKSDISVSLGGLATASVLSGLDPPSPSPA